MLAAGGIGTVSWIEMLWILFGLMGLYYNIHNIRDVYKYVDAIQEQHGANGRTVRRIERVIAFGHMRNEIFRMSFSLVVLMVGLLAAIAAPAPGARSVTLTGVIVTMGLFILQLVGNILPSALDRRQRELMGRMAGEPDYTD